MKNSLLKGLNNNYFKILKLQKYFLVRQFCNSGVWLAFVTITLQRPYEKR